MIYIVEDDAAIRELEQYALQSSGYEVQSFETSEPFWQAMRTAEPELVILDVMLPGVHGSPFPLGTTRLPLRFRQTKPPSYRNVQDEVSARCHTASSA